MFYNMSVGVVVGALRRRAVSKRGASCSTRRSVSTRDVPTRVPGPQWCDHARHLSGMSLSLVVF